MCLAHFYFSLFFLFFFFFNDTATTEIYTLSLHDALPISPTTTAFTLPIFLATPQILAVTSSPPRDRKSTRLNSSHITISYAVFCLKKKKKKKKQRIITKKYTRQIYTTQVRIYKNIH